MSKYASLSFPKEKKVKRYLCIFSDFAADCFVLVKGSLRPTNKRGTIIYELILM